ncbi:transmembrane amino acid transporter protein (macronuclear) [Tetrahymena thermophila SB210]|uniref:Transmembrane amino acid transporter protein n=1 Tax=Tetrahymena thermophila (strain SB210) TaxID=312017 RepID=Q22B39_TETTS|nr:transmembrane amino acid transporter protein [Tetrahymena thermophila SB210]EAR82516.1 transmembrane amino acid transporter protein [Tetrahymena thermophila SB210]|eukprot:XP_001030179.1 transmembrane amino acid transporter protein [Tetrahymena thermophila SB210]
MNKQKYSKEVGQELYSNPKSLFAKEDNARDSQSISDEYPLLKDVMTKYQALFVACNLLLGIAPLILPNSYLQAGALFSSVFFLLIAAISYISAEYVVESIGICNYIKFRKEQISQQYSNQLNNDDQLNGDNEGQKILQKQQKKKLKREFRINTKFELGEIAQTFWGKEAQFVVSLIVIIFLIGVTIARCISIARILKNTFSEISLLNNFYFWLGCLILFTSLFSFKNVSSFAWIQEYIAIIRLTAVSLIFFACFYQIYLDGFQGIQFKDYPLVNITNFPSLSSSTTMFFCIHHSIPAFVKPITPQKHVKWVLKGTHILGLSIILGISFFGVCAFGEALIDKYDVNFINYNFEQNEIIVYYTSALYIFLNAIAYPVFIITVRNNMMELFAPSKIPKISSEVTPYTFSFTVGILLFLGAISALATNIQFVIDLIVGTLGVIIFLIIPTASILEGRKILKNDYGMDYKLNRYCSTFPNQYLPYVIMAIGVMAFIYNSYNLAI